ncbi:Rv3654c family TadE-like protein [Glycomyces sp. NPDC048151]|uniref:Rv3654c family TadE-like protein n=1 Tax=Glycomyces sp. NPDC048151 TaxID=3364002 RepID=UPI003714CCCB
MRKERTRHRPGPSTARTGHRPGPVATRHGRQTEPGSAATPPRQRRKPTASTGSERGSATVLAAGLTAALLVTAVAFVSVGQASAARHRAQGAADAAALAGAARVLFGEGEACAAAQAMVEQSATEFQGCEVNDLEVTVRVTETANGLPAAFGPARAVSRAGPVTVE